MAPVTSAAHTLEGLIVAGKGTPAAARGTTAPQTSGSTGDAGGGAAAKAAGTAAAETSRFAGYIHTDSGCGKERRILIGP